MTIRLLPFLLLLGSFAYGQGNVYVCVQPNGNREYRNTGDTLSCRKLDLESISMIPSPPSAKGSSAADPAFPKVDNFTQKRRDQDRMQILLEEVRTEESKLAELKKEYQNGEPERQGNERNYVKYQERVGQLKDELQRTEKNIEALKREIGNLK